MIFNLRIIKPRSIYSPFSDFSKILTLLLFTLFIQGCATKSSQLIDFANVNELTNWNARGKLLIKNNKDKLSGYFFWQQQQSGDFKLVITSFIGTSLMTLEYKQGLAEIKIDGKTHQSTDPEALLYRLTGSYIPVKSMANWMLAKAPESAEKTVKQNELTRFSYRDTHLNNWQVAYQSYQTIALLKLPKRMTIDGLGNTIKLTVNDWELMAP